jgi:hypothetical protein
MFSAERGRKRPWEAEDGGQPGPNVIKLFTAVIFGSS